MTSNYITLINSLSTQYKKIPFCLLKKIRNNVSSNCKQKKNVSILSVIVHFKFLYFRFYRYL